jgi:hypothetical protein
VRAIAAALLVLAVAAPAAAEPSPEELFDQRRYATAAAGFQQRWERDHDLKDGLNAVTAWRVAGRYARARVLLAEVVAAVTPEGEAAERAKLLEARLVELTVPVRFETALDTDAIVKIDGNPAQRLGGDVIVDVGDREISVEAPRCERWVTRETALPGVELALAVDLRCDRRGTVHLVFLHERDADLRVDGAARRAGAGELDLALEPGAHRIEVRSAAGTLFDESVEVATGEVATRRVLYPWRASGGMWFFGFSTSAHGAALGASAFMGAALGRASDRWRWDFDIGLGRQPDGVRVGGSAGLEVTRHLLPPLWRARAAHAWWQAAAEPASLWFRHMSRIGTVTTAIDGSAGVVQDVTTLHLGSLGLSLDAPSWHAEVRAWPLGAYLRHDDRARVSFGVAASLLLGFRL